jgi:hypothetical protein
MWSIVVVVFLAALFAACAEARTLGPPGGGGSGGGTGTGAGGQTTTTPGGAGGGGSETSPTGGGGSAAAPVVINEIGATGTEMVEIVNPSSKPVALDDFALADTDTTNGGPKIADAARFPKGTTVQPGEHLVILCGQSAGDGVGPHDKCGSGGPDTCFYATWSVSAKNGEKVFLLSPDDAALAEAEYPKDAAATGNTWGRFPDVTGDFTETASTPGAPNALP